MADSIRQKIVDEVDKELKTITKDNGYETNVGKNVFEWLDAPVEAKDLPAIVWRDRQDPITVDSKVTHIHDLTMEIELFATGASVPKTMRKLIADVTKLIGKIKTDGRVTWSALAIDTFPVSEEMVLDENTKKLMSALVSINIQYHTAKFDAYTQ